MENFNQYPIISLEDGLKRVANKKPLFARVLGTFTANTRENELFDAIDGKDLAAAVMVTHTIKGVAANLSLIRLQKYTEELETQFKNAKESGDTGIFDAVDKAVGSKIFKDTLEEVTKIIPTLH